jgi:hypothetical protein
MDKTKSDLKQTDELLRLGLYRLPIKQLSLVRSRAPPPHVGRT